MDFIKSIKYLAFVICALPGMLMAQRVDEEAVAREEKFISATQLILLSKYKEASAIFKELAQEDPINAANYYNLSKCYLFLKENDEAIKAAQKCVNLGKSNPWYLINLAEIYIEVKNYHEAAGTYQKVAELKKDKGLYLQWAKMLVKADEKKEALAAYDVIEELFGYDDERMDERIQLLLSMNDPARAERDLIKWTKLMTRDVRIYQKLAAFYQYTDKPEKALDVFEDILKIEPKNELAIYYIKSAASIGSDDKMYLLIQDPSISLDNKIKSLIPLIEEIGIEATEEKINRMDILTSKIVALYPEQAKAHAIRGDLLTQKGDLKAAVASYKQTVAKVKSVFSVWENLMMNLLELKDYEDLYIVSNEALNYYPSQSTPYFYNALASFHLGNYSKALEMVLESGFLANPKDLEFLQKTMFLRTRISIAQNQNQGALLLLKEIEDKLASKLNSAAAEEMGDLYFRLLSKEKALFYYKKAIELGGSIMRLTKKVDSI